MDIRDKLASMGDWEVRIFRNFNWLAYNAAKWAAFCNSEGDVLNSISAIEVLSKDFISSFFTNDDDEHVNDSLLNNSDNEDDDGLLRLKLKEVFTHDDGNNDDKKNNEDGNNVNE
ncbi:hypothetical protein L6164_017152 [Bauhinia variegata]|uniref:Uncharacterized protein n=1 Tax=Bauhinia variegata TaxID=167791 RepID=A0ACB9N783_BAUVA|nr:hypothetical protein L6164_017152 [Bauhinia variegata]